MKVIIKNHQKKIPLHPKRIKQAILKALSSESIKRPGEITVCFVSDLTIRKMNLRFLGKDQPTDVLAFDSGEIAVSTDAAIRHAKIFGTSPLYELYLYVVHGLLHILGYQDRTRKQREHMQEKAENILRALSLCPFTKQKRSS
ncbi:MAG: rRNA maturation RNase YbeY [Candidatus Omnitrophota bacterium]